MPGKPVPDYQLHYIANCAVAGYPVEKICEATGLELDYVRRAIREPTEKMAQLMDHYRFRQNAMDVHFKMKTHEWLDECFNCVERTLKQEKDPRLAYEVAKDVMSAHGFRFPRDEAKGPAIGNQYNLYADQRVLNAFTQHVGSIQASVEAQKATLPAVGSIVDSRYIHTSEAAVPETAAKPTGNGSDEPDTE